MSKSGVSKKLFADVAVQVFQIPLELGGQCPRPSGHDSRPHLSLPEPLTVGCPPVAPGGPLGTAAGLVRGPLVGFVAVQILEAVLFQVGQVLEVVQRLLPNLSSQVG